MPKPFVEKFGSNNILAPLKRDEPIYRIFRYDRFEELVESKKLALASPTLWDDPFENFFLKSSVDMGDGTFAGLEILARKWYGQCWTTEKDTDALWRIYSHDKCSVRVKTTVGKLFSALYKPNDLQAKLKYFIGKVNYMSQDEISLLLDKTRFMSVAEGAQNHGFAKLLCIKRNEFKHENEVRVLFNDIASEYATRNVLFFDFDPNSLLEEVCLDPRIEEKLVSRTEKKLKAIGLTLPVVRSHLYDFQKATIKM